MLGAWALEVHPFGEPCRLFFAELSADGDKKVRFAFRCVHRNRDKVDVFERIKPRLLGELIDTFLDLRKVHRVSTGKSGVAFDKVFLGKGFESVKKAVGKRADVRGKDYVGFCERVFVYDLCGRDGCAGFEGHQKGHQVKQKHGTHETDLLVVMGKKDGFAFSEKPPLCGGLSKPMRDVVGTITASPICQKRGKPTTKTESGGRC